MDFTIPLQSTVLFGKFLYIFNLNLKEQFSLYDLSVCTRVCLMFY